MNYRIVIKPLAEIDILEIYKWYGQQREGLGDIFLDEFERSISFLEINPRQYQVRHKEVRMVNIRRFPVCAHYTIEDNRVFIHAVLSTSQDPKIWQERSESNSDTEL